MKYLTHRCSVLKLVAIVGSLIVAVSSPCFAAQIDIPSDPADGALTRDISPLTDTALPSVAWMRVGVSGSFTNSTRTKNNAVFFFELPTLVSGALTSAELSFQYRDKHDGAYLSFNLDVWGLGYVDTAVLDTDWLFFGDGDAGPGLGVTNRTKVRDSLLWTTSGDPNDTPVTISTSDATLLSFVQSLYDNGATGGDFAVFRLNPSSDIANPDVGGNPGYMMGFRENAGDPPTLALTGDIEAVPEPSTIAILGVCLFGLKRKAARPRPKGSRATTPL